MKNYGYLVNTSFGRLTVEKVADRVYARNGKILGPRLLCKCICGNSKEVYCSSLLSGDTKSCGCLRRETSRTIGLAAKTHGHGNAVGEGRAGASKEYRAWVSAKARCENPKDKDYENYGGRGIKFHPAWVGDFQAFYDHVGPAPSTAHSLDRKRVNGNYEPGNIRWASRKIQQRNQRGNVRGEIQGVTYTLSEAVERFGVVSYSTAKSRIWGLGWSFARAVLTPVSVS